MHSSSPPFVLHALRGLRHEMSSPAQAVGSWVQTSVEAWMSVCVCSAFVLSCVGSGLVMGWSPF
jgi:hypothetical protein